MNLFHLIEKMKANAKLQGLEAYPVISNSLLPILEVMGQEVREALNNKENVTLVGLGQLLPLTDKKMPDKQIVRFRASNILKSALNQGNAIGEGEPK